MSGFIQLNHGAGRCLMRISHQVTGVKDQPSSTCGAKPCIMRITIKGKWLAQRHSDVKRVWAEPTDRLTQYAYQQERSLVGIELKQIILGYVMLIRQMLINFNI